MDSKVIQGKIDSYLDKFILFIIPRWLKPNYFTYLRLLLTPFLYYLLRLGYLWPALFVFIVAVSTDFIDGSLARTRHQKTKLGIVLDPIADKLLIAVVLISIGLEYLVIKLILVFIAIEVIGIFVNLFYQSKLGKPVPANTFGKIKMISQSISVGLFLLSIIIKSSILTVISEYILFMAIFFAALSAIFQIYYQLKKAPILKDI